MKDDHVAVLLEDINGKIDRMAEGVGSLKETAMETNRRLKKVEQDTELIPAIKAAVTDQSAQLKDHEIRVTKLEHRIA